MKLRMNLSYQTVLSKSTGLQEKWYCKLSRGSSLRLNTKGFQYKNLLSIVDNTAQNRIHNVKIFQQEKGNESACHSTKEEPSRQLTPPVSSF